MRQLVFILLLAVSFTADAKVSFAKCAHWIQRALSDVHWNTKGPYVGVVNPYSSGALLAQRLTKRGYRVLAIHDAPEIIPALRDSYDPFSVYKDFYPSTEMNLAGSEKMANRLAPYLAPAMWEKYALRAIFNGSEGGTVLTDALTHFLHLPGNDPVDSLTKRDKAKMHNRLAERGVAHIRHLRTSSLEKILTWIHGPENNGRFPVVIKPLDSAGTQGVSICETEEEVRIAFKDLVENEKARTVFNKDISEVLVQEYLEGIDTEGDEQKSEYVLNTVSSGGHHIATDIVRYRKKRVRRPNGSHTSIYLFDEFIPLDSELAWQLRQYAFSVLDATGVQYGAAHMEVMLTARGPVLIEIGARPAGSGMPELASHAYTVHPLDILIDAYLDEKAFRQLWFAESRPGTVQKFKKHARQVQLISSQEGYLSQLPFLKALKALPSYVSHTFSVKMGGKVLVTEDMISAPGHVELAHEDPAVVERDYQQIREWERQGFFTLVPTAPFAVPFSILGQAR